MQPSHPNKLTTSQAGYGLIKQAEGLRLKVYKCEAGKLTIGYGHKVTASEIGKLTSITQAQADAMLVSDCKIAEIYINASVRVSLTQYQFDALVSFAFNLGVGNLEESTLLKKLNAGDVMGAAAEFPRWNKVRTEDGELIESPGLTTRRLHEQAMFIGKAL